MTSESSAKTNKKEIQTNENLVKLEKVYKVYLEQVNGQRILRHVGNSVPPPKEDSCEVFVGRIPRNILEDELYPLFASIGQVYESRLMMDFSGNNRGFCFVKYTNSTDANKAICRLNQYEIKPNHCIGVVKSKDNCNLKIEYLPLNIETETIIKKIAETTQEIKQISVYKNIEDTNRFAIVTYKTHRDAAMARREFVPRKTALFEKRVNVNWAEPELEFQNVIEEIGDIDDNGEITIQEPKHIRRKKLLKTDNKIENGTRPRKGGNYCIKTNGKPKSEESINPNNSRKKVIQEQKHNELPKKKSNNRTNYNRKKYQKSNKKLELLENDKLHNLNATSNSNPSIAENHQTYVDSSCKANMLSDTVSESAAESINFSLFDEFRFSRPCLGTRSLSQNINQGNEDQIDDLSSSFQNALYIDMKKTNDYGYASCMQPVNIQIPACNMNHNTEHKNGQCYTQSVPHYYQPIRDHYDQISVGTYINNNVYQFPQVQEAIIQPINSTFTPRFTTIPNNEMYYLSSDICYNALPSDEICAAKPCVKPLGCQNRYIPHKTCLNPDLTKFHKITDGSLNYERKHTLLKSVGISNRKGQTQRSDNWTTRIVQNALENIPPGARPILRRTE